MGGTENLSLENFCLGGKKDQFEFLQVKKKLHERNTFSALSTELKSKSLIHRLHCGGENLKQCTQKPTTSGPASYAKFPSKVVNPKERFMSEQAMTLFPL